MKNNLSFSCLYGIFFISLFPDYLTIKTDKTMSGCKLLGYYYDLEDIKLYADKSADEIVADFLNGLGAFSISVEYMDLYLGGWNVEVTTDGKYAVVKDINYCADFTNLDQDNCFIDIYELL